MLAPPAEDLRRPTACAWCGAPLDAADLPPGLRPCAVCGSATTSPWPTKAELEAAYGDWYRPASGRFGPLGDAILRRTRARLAARIDALAPPGPVLDVGSGDGTLLRALERRGRRAVGLERGPGEEGGPIGGGGQREVAEDRSSTGAARREAPAGRGGPEVREAGLDEVNGQWAAVVLWHSLEHLREPGADLRRAAALLAPRGVLFIAVPNYGSLQARAFGERWLALDVPRHLVHVPAETLIRTLEDQGLEVLRTSHLRGGQVAFGWLHGLVGLLPGHPDVYEAIRSPAARRTRQGGGGRAAALAAAALLAPLALALAGIEAALRRGGSVYVEARRP